MDDDADEIGFERDRVDEILSNDVNRARSYREFENRYVFIAGPR